jgi:hypothetical protein
LSTEAKAWNWRTLFLLGWGFLILFAGAIIICTWLVSWISPTGARIGLMIAILCGLCLIWLAVFLQDSALLLAILMAGAIWWIYTTFEVNVEAHVPSIIAGGCLLGGTLGGILGGVIRKVNKSSPAFSLMFTGIGCLLGFILGYGVILLFSWMLWV